MTSFPVMRAPEPLRSRFPAGGALLRRAISGIDDQIGRIQKVSPFSDDEKCILRFAPVRSKFSFRLADGTEIRRGDPVADLHCWNEHAPKVAEGGPDLGWGRNASRQLTYSLALLANSFETIPELRNVRACRARVTFVGQGGSNKSLSRIIERLGFEDVDEGFRSVPARLHDAFENILLGAMVWTHNPHAMRRDKLIREQRPVWSSRATVLRLHGQG